MTDPSEFGDYTSCWRFGNPIRELIKLETILAMSIAKQGTQIKRAS